MRWRQPCGFEMLAAVHACKRADGDRRMRRASSDRADGCHRRTAMLSENGMSKNLPRLALLGRPAQRRVAFEMFDRAVAFTVCEKDVVNCHIMLQVHQGLLASAAAELGRCSRRAGQK